MSAMNETARIDEKTIVLEAEAAVRTLARQTRRVLSSPRQCVAAVRRSQAVDRRYHRVMGGRPGSALGVGRPVGSRVIGGARPARVRRVAGAGGRCPVCGGGR